MKNKKICLIIAIGLALCSLIAGAFALLSNQTEKKVNTFTFGNIKIELKEPLWENAVDDNYNKIPDVAESLSPNETIAKNPMITNVGTNDAYLYFKISVPKKAVDYIDDNGSVVTANENVPINLFSYITDENWILFLTDTSEEDCNHYYYYYKDVVKPKETTSSIFNEVSFIDVIEGQLEDDIYKVNVFAYGVQTLNEEGKDNAFAAWNEMAKNNKLPLYS